MRREIIYFETCPCVHAVVFEGSYTRGECSERGDESINCVTFGPTNANLLGLRLMDNRSSDIKCFRN